VHVTTIALSSADLASITADALVVAIAPLGGRRKGVVLVGGAAGLKAAPKRRLEESLAALGATGKAGDVVTVPGAGIAAAPLVLAVGVGAGPWTDESLRRAAGTAVRSLAGHRRVVMALPTESARALEAVAQGAVLGGYSYDAYRVDSKNAHKNAVDRVTLPVADAKDAGTLATVARARAVAAAVNLARDLVNTPSLDLPPAALAQAALDAVDGLAVDVEILDETALAAGGYGGILGVGRGSANPPRLARLAYRPEGAVAHLALVGKGITFDTGGISIKPSAGLHEMKGDMGGAAAVIAATAAIARLRLPVAVTTYVCAAENMPSGTAIKPGDVLHTYSGKTIEVLDTDAEGRLVLSDGLTRAQEDKPDVLIDVATLTGAQAVALGSRTSGIMANDDDLRAAVHAASERAGEAMWPMPQPEELRANLDSVVADIANIALSGRRDGGMLSASIFLREFVKDSQRWAHLDIAGPSYNNYGPWAYTPKGGTGASVRTLVQVAQDMADGVL
jgi:leucyl aminopeptidase